MNAQEHRQAVATARTAYHAAVAKKETAPTLLNQLDVLHLIEDVRFAHAVLTSARKARSDYYDSLAAEMHNFWLDEGLTETEQERIPQPAPDPPPIFYLGNQSPVILTVAEHEIRDFGNMSVGTVWRIPKGKGAGQWTGQCRQTLLMGNFKTKAAAIERVKQYWQEHFSGKALEKRFEARNKGGLPVRFIHATNDSIVAATFQNGWSQTSYNLDGKCGLYSEEGETDFYDLVPKA